MATVGVKGLKYNFSIFERFEKPTIALTHRVFKPSVNDINNFFIKNATDVHL